MTRLEDLRRAVARGQEVVKAIDEYALLDPHPVAKITEFAKSMAEPAGLWILWSYVTAALVAAFSESTTTGGVVLAVALVLGLGKLQEQHRLWRRRNAEIPGCVQVLRIPANDVCAHGTLHGRSRKLCETCADRIEAQRGEMLRKLARADRQLADAEAEERQRQESIEAEERRRRDEVKRRNEEARRRAEEGQRVREQQRQRELRTLAGLRKMDPDEFEEHIAKLYAAMGYRTEVTPPSGDDGVDVMAVKHGERVAIQCKRYGPKNNVGSKEVRELHGSAAFHGADRAVFITTSDYTKAAREAGDRLGIELVDAQGLMALVQQHEPA